MRLMVAPEKHDQTKMLLLKQVLVEHKVEVTVLVTRVHECDVTIPEHKQTSRRQRWEKNS